MTRLRSVNNVTVLTFEEKTRVVNVFTLLVAIDLRLPQSTKAKTRQRKTQKTKHKPVKQKPSDIKCPVMCCSSRTARRDLYLAAFA